MDLFLSSDGRIWSTCSFGSITNSCSSVTGYHIEYVLPTLSFGDGNIQFLKCVLFKIPYDEQSPQ